MKFICYGFRSNVICWLILVFILRFVFTSNVLSVALVVAPSRFKSQPPDFCQYFCRSFSMSPLSCSAKILKRIFRYQTQTCFIYCCVQLDSTFFHCLLEELARSKQKLFFICIFAANIELIYLNGLKIKI